MVFGRYNLARQLIIKVSIFLIIVGGITGQHKILGHYPPDSETPFSWRAGRLIMVPLTVYMLTFDS